jgi:hypothetical protein
MSRRTAAHGRRLSDDGELATLHQSGASIRRIAAALGLSPTMVAWLVKEQTLDAGQPYASGQVQG